MKEKIKNDIKFKSKCKKIGLDTNNIEIINLDNDYIILNHSSNSNIYLLFDKNYNIFGIENLSDINKTELYKKVSLIYNYYLNTPDGITSLFKFPYPFQNFTLKDIIELGNKVNIIDLNYNLNLIPDKESKINYQRKIRLLSYLKFLSLQINNYFTYIYKMKLLNLDVPNIYLYVISLINKINSLSSNNILSDIGEDINNNNLSYLVYDISKLLQEEKLNNNKDLDTLANSFLTKDSNKTLKKKLEL